MNQTESGRKARGSGVGILAERGPLSANGALPCPKGPRLQLRACFAAPDAQSLGGGRSGFNHVMEAYSAEKLRSDRNS